MISSHTHPGLIVQQAVLEVINRLEQAGVSNASGEARELVAAALGCRPFDLMLNPRWPLTPAQKTLLDRWVEERCRQTPLAYVLGEWDFMGFRFLLTKDVLIPRPETEGLVELVIKHCGSWIREEGPLSAARPPQWKIADVGTGSGCMAVSLAKFLADARLWAVDVSAPALALARKNAERHGVNHRIVFRQGDLLEGGEGDFHLVVANLPYVAQEDLLRLSPEVLQEPRLALEGGPDGLDVIRRLIPQAYRSLRSGGSIFLEVGYNQAEAVAEAVSREGFAEVRVHKDFAGVPRFVIGSRP